MDGSAVPAAAPPLLRPGDVEAVLEAAQRLGWAEAASGGPPSREVVAAKGLQWLLEREGEWLRPEPARAAAGTDVAAALRPLLLRMAARVRLSHVPRAAAPAVAELPFSGCVGVATAARCA
jgi:hypothetical protein